MDWVSVKDRPLIDSESRQGGDEYWVCTPDGEGEFMAAISEMTDGVPGWWIRHCVIEDEVGLCVVGETENEIAGYEVEDVEFWMKIEPPKI